MSGKVCCKCKQFKALDLFWNDRTKKDDKQTQCIECLTVRNKAYRDNNPSYFKNHSKRWYESTGKHQNQERYSRSKEAFKQRRKDFLMTVRGRLLGLLNTAKTRAAKSDREFSIDIDFLADLWTAQDGKCALTGMQLSLDDYEYGKRFYRPYSPSLDRINADGGYTPDNTRLVCTVINLALNRFGDSVFDVMCEAYIKKKRST